MTNTDTKENFTIEGKANVLVNRAHADSLAAPSAELKDVSAQIAQRQSIGWLYANDNFTDEELPTSVSATKIREHEDLAKLMSGKPVTICPTVKPAIDNTPWAPMRADNDNQAPLSWPLAEALRRSGKADDLHVCELYRGLASIMAADPLQGRDAQMSTDDEPGLDIESRGTLDGDKALKSTGEVVGTGEIKYKGVRRTARTPGASTKALPKGDGDSGARYTVSTAKFSERTLIAQIDSRKTFARLQAAAGPLLWAFEGACLDGLTLTEIGEARDFKDKQASAAGRALVFEAVFSIAEEWRVIRQEEQALEKQAEGNVIRFRKRHAAALDRFLGRAA